MASNYTITLNVAFDASDVERGQRTVNNSFSLMEKAALRAFERAQGTLNKIPAEVQRAANQVSQAFRAGAKSDVFSSYETQARDAFGRIVERARSTGRGIKDALQASTSGLPAGNAGGGGAGLGAGLLAGLGGAAIIGTLTSIGRSALDAAIGIDKSRQTLVALTGSTEAANRKLAELRQLAARTPGLTASVVADTYAQLKAAGDIADQTINRVLQGVGRLNAVFSIDSVKDFSRNILQIFKQGFEVGDVKEALGRVPIFDEILKQAFGTNNPEALRKLKDSGALTLNKYLEGISTAIENNPALTSVAESIGSRFEKARDNILFAIAPLGDEIANVILPLLTRIGGGAGEMGNTIAAELRRSRDEFFALTDSAAYFGNAVANALGRGIGVGFDLKKELRDLRSIVDFVTGGVVLLQDVFEIFGAVARGAVQSVVLVIESALAGALSLVGIKIEALEKDMKRLGFGIATADARISAGLKNAAAFANRNAQAGATGAIDAGNAIPIDLRTGRPINPADYQPFRAAVAVQTALGGSRSGGGGAISDAVRQTQEILRARQDAVRSGLDNIAKLERQASQDSLELLRAQYELGKLNTREYYTERFRLAEAGIQAEIASLIGQRAEVEKQLSLAKVGSADRIKLEERIGDLLTEQLLKTRSLTLAAVQGAAEFKKALGSLPADLTSQLELQVQLASPENVPEIFRRVRQQQELLSQQASQFDVADAALRVEEVRIQNQVNQGILTEVEGRRAALLVQRQMGTAMIAALEAQREIAASAFEADPAEATAQAVSVLRITEQIEGLRGLGVELTSTQRFMRGFGSEIEDTGDIFERFGSNVARNFRSLKDLFANLRNSFKQLLGDLVSNTFQNALRNIFGALTGNGQRGQSASFANTVNGQQGAGFNLSNIISNVLTGGGNTGYGGFLTPSFAGSNFNRVAAANIAAVSNPLGVQTLSTAISTAFGAGGRISIPPSVTQQSAEQASTARALAQAINQSGGALASGGSISKLLGGITGGGAVGLSSAFLGAGLGAGVGGQSTIGRILGLVGGSAVGLGLSYGAAVFGAGGSLGAASLAALGPAAIIGAPLLIGALLLGRAAQRRRDETASGDFLQQAVDAIHRMREAVQARQITSEAEARGIFESQILRTFISQINTIQTRSVRESRLMNQTADLRRLFESSVIPKIQAAAAAQQTAISLRPTYRTGGFVSGDMVNSLALAADANDAFSSLIRVSGGERVISAEHAALIGHHNLAAAGVPMSGAHRVQVPDAKQQYAIINQLRPFTGLVPGVFNALDDKLLRAAHGSYVLTPTHQNRLALLHPGRLPGFAAGGATSPSRVPSMSRMAPTPVTFGPQEKSAPTNITCVIVADEAAATALLRSGKNVVIGTVKEHVRRTGASPGSLAHDIVNTFSLKR